MEIRVIWKHFQNFSIEIINFCLFFFFTNHYGIFCERVIYLINMITDDLKQSSFNQLPSHEEYFTNGGRQCFARSISKF